jgi:hypothetical protein
VLLHSSCLPNKRRKRCGRAVLAHWYLLSHLCLPLLPCAPLCLAQIFRAASSALDPDALQKLLDDKAHVFQPVPPGLPPERGSGHVIPTVPNMPPPFKRPYRMTPQEKEEVQRQVTDLLQRGLIEPSVSPYGAPVLFVQKKDGSLRMCIDYRQLNKLTIRDRFPLPHIQDLLDQVSQSTIFSSLDLQTGYNQIRIADSDVEKTAFTTPYGHFQFKVLSFGLTNAPATFQRLMHRIFAPYIGKFVLVYLDDVLIMSKAPEEHLTHLRLVLEVLEKQQLYAKLSKCEFGKTTLKFLGHVVSAGTVSADPDKIKVLQNWDVPRSLQQLRSFLGLANYFRRFVPNYSTLAAPLTALTAYKVVFTWQDWPPAELAAFNALKHALVSPPVPLPDSDKPFVIQADASNVGCGATLMQDDKVVAYMSRKWDSAQSNWSAGEQELFALICALREWRCYVDRACVTLHHPLVWLTSQAHLSSKQTRWMEFLARFDFELEYVRGVDNAAADSLSRNPAFTAALISASISSVLTRSRSRAVTTSPLEGGEQSQSPHCTRETDCAAPTSGLAAPQERAGLYLLPRELSLLLI